MSLSLYTIEDSLAELLEDRMQLLAEVQTLSGVDHDQLLEERKAELANVEKLLAEYQLLEVRKTDNCHRFLTSLKSLVPAMRAEAAAIAARAARLETAAEWLKGRIMDAMSVAGKKRIDGLNGRYLLKKGNGGLAKLHIDGWDNGWSDEAILPREYQDITLRIPASVYDAIIEQLHVAGFETTMIAMISRSEPSQDRIRAALAQDCPYCAGRGKVIDVAYAVAEGASPKLKECQECHGTGKQLVPGARLLDRGEHLEIR